MRGDDARALGKAIAEPIQDSTKQLRISNRLKAIELAIDTGILNKGQSAKARSFIVRVAEGRE